MEAVVADIHTVIWYLQSSSKLSVAALAALDSATQIGYLIYISSSLAGNRRNARYPHSSIRLC